MCRQTGRTTSMLEAAYLSNAPHVIILAPKYQVLRYLMDLTHEILPFKPDKVERSKITLADQVFHYMVPDSETPNRLRGIGPFEVFADHTLFEPPFVNQQQMEAYYEIIALERQYREVKDD